MCRVARGHTRRCGWRWLTGLVIPGKEKKGRVSKYGLGVGLSALNGVKLMDEMHVLHFFFFYV